MTVQIVNFTVKGMDASVVSASLGRPYTVVYDGTCKVCGRLVRVLRGWDKNELLDIVPSQAPGVHARFPWIPARAFTESVQLVAENGETWQGAAAIEQLLNVLPKGKLISWIFKIPFARPLADRFYRWFARNRYKLGCGQHCQLRALQVDFRDEEPPPTAATASRASAP